MKYNKAWELRRKHVWKQMVKKNDSNLLGFLRIKPIFSFQFRQGHSYEAHVMQLKFTSP